MSKPIIFFGNERLATGTNTKALVFKGLISAGYDIKALIISQKPTRTLDLEVVNIAKDHNIQIKAYDDLRSSIQEIADFKVDTAILVAYGRIIPKEILDLFKVGIINIHPSILPRHRGPTPIESVILNGERHTGVSIMQLAQEMDAGPLYSQQTLELNGQETKQELVDRLDGLASQLLLSSLSDIMDGTLSPTDQDSTDITYDQLITKHDGYLDWHEPWEIIERKSRAYAGWPDTSFNISGIKVNVLRMHSDSANGTPGTYLKYNDQLAVYCQDRIVIIDELIPAGSKKMSGPEFLRGYSSKIF